MLIKAGTYRFNDVLTEAEFEQSIDITTTAEDNGTIATVKISKLAGMQGDNFALVGLFYSIVIDGEEQLNEETPMVVYGGAQKDYWHLPLQTHTIPKDTEVDDTFGAWYIANTDYDTVNGGETPETPTKKFTRLYLGEVAYSSNGKRFRKLQKEEYVEPTLEAGLYDADDNLIASWDTLVNTYGMDCIKDYSYHSTDTNYPKTDVNSPYYVLSNNTEFANGVKILIGDSVTSIGNYAFSYCGSLTNIIIPNSVTNIGDYAFYKCETLQNVIIPNTVKDIGIGLFSYCNKLTDVYIFPFMTSVPYQMYYECRSITSVNIPQNVTEIHSQSFWFCTSLISVTIPNSVTSIEMYAFSECTSLTEIVFTGTMEEWNGIEREAYSFRGVPATYVQCTDGQVTL